MPSLRSRRLDGSIGRKKERAHECLPLARASLFAPTTSKRVLRRLKYAQTNHLQIVTPAGRNKPQEKQDYTKFSKMHKTM